MLPFETKMNISNDHSATNSRRRIIPCALFNNVLYVGHNVLDTVPYYSDASKNEEYVRIIIRFDTIDRLIQFMINMVCGLHSDDDDDIVAAAAAAATTKEESMTRSNICIRITFAKIYMRSDQSIIGSSVSTGDNSFEYKIFNNLFKEESAAVASNDSNDDDITEKYEDIFRCIRIYFENKKDSIKNTKRSTNRRIAKEEYSMENFLEYQEPLEDVNSIPNICLCFRREHVYHSDILVAELSNRYDNTARRRKKTSILNYGKNIAEHIDILKGHKSRWSDTDLSLVTTTEAKTSPIVTLIYNNPKTTEQYNCDKFYLKSDLVEYLIGILSHIRASYDDCSNDSSSESQHQQQHIFKKKDRYSVWLPSKPNTYNSLKNVVCMTQGEFDGSIRSGSGSSIISISSNRYPIYIVSAGRWNKRWTSRYLDFCGISYFMVVEPDEYDLYFESLKYSYNPRNLRRRRHSDESSLDCYRYSFKTAYNESLKLKSLSSGSTRTDE